MCIAVAEAQAELVDDGLNLATPMFAGRFFGLGKDDGGNHVLADPDLVGRGPNVNTTIC